MTVISQGGSMNVTNIRGVWMGTVCFAVLTEGQPPKFMGVSDLTMVPGQFHFPNTPAANDAVFDSTPPQ